MHPSEIRIGQYELSVYNLYNMMVERNIILENYQNHWSIERKSRSVESILLGLTMTPIYVDASYPDEWLILDGGKRLNAIYEFLQGSFVLKEVDFLADLQNYSFYDLPQSIQRKFQEAKLTIYSFNQGISPQARLNLIRRIVPDIKKGLSARMQERLLSLDAQYLFTSLPYLDIIYEKLNEEENDEILFSVKLNFVELHFTYLKKYLYTDFKPSMKKEDLVIYLNRYIEFINIYNFYEIWNKGTLLLDELISNGDYPYTTKKFLIKYIEYFIYALGYNSADYKNMPPMIFQGRLLDLTESLINKQKFIRNSKSARITFLHKMLTQ